MKTKKTVKYVHTGGLPFTEKNELAKLVQLASEGWKVKELVAFGEFFKMEKSEPEQVTFSIDYFYGEEGDLPEYLSIFSASGWEMITSLPTLSKVKCYLFKAPVGTVPIHSEKATEKERYAFLKKRYFRQALFPLILLLIFVTFATIFPEYTVFRILGWLSFGAVYCMVLAGIVYYLKSLQREVTKKKIFWWGVIAGMVTGAIGAISGALGVFLN